MRNALLFLFNLAFLLSIGSYIQAQTHVTSDACKTCHSTKFNDWEASGHPYKFTITNGNTGPEYPAEAINFQDTWLTDLADGTITWENIAGVIGGYGWKARFVGTDGHVIGTANSSFYTGGGHNQINFFGGENHGWADYHTTTETIYNYSCFKCHTTGGTQDGTWLDGVDGLGNFSEGGIGCEACHGPGSDHIAGPTAENIDLVYEQAHLDNSLGGLEINGIVQTPNTETDDVNFLCGTCHNRSYTDPINSSGGFIKHHEQWDEFMATKHGEGGMTCITCHDPHKRVIWDGDGITKTCESCHTTQAATVNHSSGATCIDCHMPFAAKSGTTRGESGYKGDVRSHLMAITVNDASMFNDDGSAVRDDESRSPSLSPHYACLGCHNDDPADNIADKTIESAVASASNMHGTTSIASQQRSMDLSVYPNPAIDFTEISYTITRPANVTVLVYNAAGQVIYTVFNDYQSQGKYTFNWNGVNMANDKVNTGIYFVNVKAGNISTTHKLMFIK